MDVGKRIAYYRTLKNFSVNKLAMESGISQSYLRDIELGNKNPTVEILSYICDSLDLSLSEFFSEETSKKFSDDPLVKKIYELTPEQRDTLLAFINTITK